MMQSLEQTPTTPPENADKHTFKKELKSYQKKLFKLQHKFYADGRFGLLIILQGMDASGKDSAIRRGLNGMNPAGMRVKSFKRPTEEERQHDFLWRIYNHLPKRSMVAVFNRSHYEDIIVPKMNGTLSDAVMAHRISLINQLESHLVMNNIHVLKFYLHISNEEQRTKIEERKTDPTKKWKYEQEDETTLEEWKHGAGTYDMVLEQCQAVPWHIVPADKKWYKNHYIAKTVTEYFEQLDLHYPKG